MRFIEGSLRHTKGRFAGHPFTLADWQRRDIIEPTFGTLLPDGRRRYRTLFAELPRKNGKSQLASSLALTMLLIDNEPGAEVLCLASDIDQGRVVFGECKRMVEASPEILQAFHPVIYRDAIEVPDTGSVLRVLSADERGIHGRNPSALVLDELHTFASRKQREFFTGATTAMGTRRNPLSVLISSAGWDKDSICYELHQYSAEVRAGLRDDPSFLSVFYGADDTADWRDRDVWRAANPALNGKDGFLNMEYLEAEFIQAEAMPSRQNAFRTFYLNQWVGAESRYIDLSLWDSAAGHPTTDSQLAGRTAYMGIDLASVDDLCVSAMVLPCLHDEGAWDVFLRCYLPEATLTHHRHADLYRGFHQGGWLTLTPGEIIDYSFIVADVVATAKRLNIRAINIDARFQGIQVAIALRDHGLDVREMMQTHAAFAAPMREFERLVKSGRLHHGGHPVLRWAIDHLVVRTDSNGDQKPDKTRSHEKIDPVVAVVMALDLSTRTIEPPAPSYQMFVLGR